MKITVYTKTGCPWCDKAKIWLDVRDIDYAWINLGDEDRQKFYEETETSTMPQIFFDDVRIGGYQELVEHGMQYLATTKGLLDPSVVYKPILYPSFVELAKTHEKMHWVEDEIDLTDDVNDWKSGKLSDPEKQFIKNVLTLFTQMDLAVAEYYVDYFLPKFKNTEVRSMLMSFANRECFSDDTEVLTNTGWKLFKDVSDDDLVAQWDTETEGVSFAKPLDRIVKPYSGKMHLYDNKSTSICVTPKHELVLINPHTHKVTKQKSEDGSWGRNFFYPNAGYTEVVDEVDEEILLLDRIMVMLAADGSFPVLTPSGSVDRPNSRNALIHVSKERKIERIRMLVSEYEALTGHSAYAERVGADGRYVMRWNVPDHIDISKIKSYEWMGDDLSTIPLQRLQTIIDEAVHWDSSPVSKNTYSFYTSNEHATKRMSAFAALCGYRTNTSIARTKEQFEGHVFPNGNTIQNPQDAYRMNVVDRTKTTYPYRIEKDYDGMVYCFTMPKGTLVCRREGKPFVSSNCTHFRAYALLNDTLGFPDDFYSAFLEYVEMTEKVENMTNMSTHSHTATAKALAKTVFNEGVSLYASFAMLLNFTRFNKMKGMGKVVDWSLKDENCHATGMAMLFRQFCEEHPRIVNDALKKDIYEMARYTVELEDKFIDLAFDIEGAIEGITKEQVKKYVRWMADERLVSLGLKRNYEIEENPFDWIDWVVGGARSTSFFEQRVSEYSVGGLQGTYDYKFLERTD